MMDRRSFLAGLTAPAVLALAAKAQSAVRRETLRVAPETLTNIFDPHFTTSFTTRDFSYLIFDTLFAVNDRWEPRPQMIERWDRSADGMTWTFALREGLAFHDGSAVTSEDCAASLRRWGTRDALGGLLIGATKALEPIDARRFQLQLREPFGFVLDALAKPGAMVPMMMLGGWLRRRQVARSLSPSVQGRTGSSRRNIDRATESCSCAMKVIERGRSPQFGPVAESMRASNGSS